MSSWGLKPCSQWMEILIRMHLHVAAERVCEVPGHGGQVKGMGQVLGSTAVALPTITSSLGLLQGRRVGKRAEKTRPLNNHSKTAQREELDRTSPANSPGLRTCLNLHQLPHGPELLQDGLQCWLAVTGAAVRAHGCVHHRKFSCAVKKTGDRLPTTAKGRRGGILTGCWGLRTYDETAPKNFHNLNLGSNFL